MRFMKNVHALHLRLIPSIDALTDCIKRTN